MAKKKKMNRESVLLECEETHERNYITEKSVKAKGGGQTAKLRIKKYCPKLRKHTWHTEKKK